jgi:hypothetical protein
VQQQNNSTIEYLKPEAKSKNQLPSRSALKYEPTLREGPKSSTSHNNSKNEICPPKTGTSVTLKPPLHAMNRQRRNEIKRLIYPREKRPKAG